MQHQDQERAEILEMLVKIFPPKPEPPAASELPPEMAEIVAAAQALDIRVPHICIVDHITTCHIRGMGGQVNFNDYSQAVVLIARYGYSYFDGYYERELGEQCRSLAHELGHLHALRHNRDRLYSENYADSIRDILFPDAPKFSH